MVATPKARIVQAHRANAPIDAHHDDPQSGRRQLGYESFGTAPLSRFMGRESADCIAQTPGCCAALTKSHFVLPMPPWVCRSGNGVADHPVVPRSWASSFSSCSESDVFSSCPPYGAIRSANLSSVIFSAIMTTAALPG